MKINTLFEKKKPVISFEIFPPKRDTTIKSIDKTLEILSELKPDFISVTFGAGGSLTNNLTIEIADKIKNKYHIEPLVHLTCINHTKEEINTILMKLHDIGIMNILALRGDRNPDIKPKEDFTYASDLIKFINSYKDFSVSGACYPEGHIETPDIVTDIKNLKKKVESGASHLISQLFFDNNIFYSFREKLKIADINVPVEAGIMPVVNKAQIERMVSLCGASLPDKFIRIMNKYENNKEALFDAGMIYAVNQIVDLLANDVDGIHIYTMNNPIVAERICGSIKNLV